MIILRKDGISSLFFSGPAYCSADTFAGLIFIPPLLLFPKMLLSS